MNTLRIPQGGQEYVVYFEDYSASGGLKFVTDAEIELKERSAKVSKGGVMNIPLAAKFEGKKYMWDGIQYETEDAAKNIAESYQKEGFEVKLSQNTDMHLVYTRRIAAKQAAE